MAMTGLWANNLCHASQALAIDSVLANSPVITNNWMHTFSATPYSNAGRLGAQVSVYSFDMQSGTTWWHQSLIYFAPCDPTLYATPTIDSAGILAVFGWGFASIIFFFFLGYTIAVAIQAIKKV